MKDICPKCGKEMNRDRKLFFCTECHDVYVESRQFKIIDIISLILSIFVDGFVLFPIIYLFVPGFYFECLVGLIVWEINERIRQWLLIHVLDALKIPRFDFLEHTRPDTDTYD